ncbi:MAG: FAD-dependent oxidoreductase, partial [Actinomycetota bacterium]|nr:FAD-dependent oxidoreductase [Actinomycetota bacterium]
MSRRHSVVLSPSNVVTVVGGKLATYRRMAADAVDVVVRVLGSHAGRSATARLLLRGAGRAQVPGATDPALAAHLCSRYGTEASALLGLISEDNSLAEPLVPDLPYVRAEAIWAVRHEMARNLDDILSRRTRALVLARDAATQT